ncbi:hypothetical protein NIES2101_31960 [Calothrix sp. HK-06]|nr:hypothetical protein NIES2101_31960 [Calothrix sp. HK-06]
MQFFCIAVQISRKIRALTAKIWIFLIKARNLCQKWLWKLLMTENYYTFNLQKGMRINDSQKDCNKINISKEVKKWNTISKLKNAGKNG